MKLLIAIPTNDYIHYEFMNCLIRLVEKLKDDGIDFDVAIQGGTLVYVARDKLAFKAIDEGYTHVLWFDADMIFNEDILDDLLFAGKSFVSAIYHGRRAPHLSCIFDQIYPDIVMYEEYPSDTFKIAGCGFGCVLIETSIIESVCINKNECFVPLPGYGEDIAFCKRATDLGHKIWCEPSVVCGHIGHITIYPEDYEVWKTTVSNYDEVKK